MQSNIQKYNSFYVRDTCNNNNNNFEFTRSCDLLDYGNSNLNNLVFFFTSDILVIIIIIIIIFNSRDSHISSPIMIDFDGSVAEQEEGELDPKSVQSSIQKYNSFYIRHTCNNNNNNFEFIKSRDLLDYDRF